MKVTILVEGRIESRSEDIEAMLEVPDDWHPDYGEFVKVRGTIVFLMEQMEKFRPKGERN